MYVGESEVPYENNTQTSSTHVSYFLWCDAQKGNVENLSKTRSEAQFLHELFVYTSGYIYHIFIADHQRRIRMSHTM